jgi:hypothetical protein
MQTVHLQGVQNAAGLLESQQTLLRSSLGLQLLMMPDPAAAVLSLLPLLLPQQLQLHLLVAACSQPPHLPLLLLLLLLLLHWHQTHPPLAPLAAAAAALLPQPVQAQQPKQHPEGPPLRAATSCCLHCVSAEEQPVHAQHSTRRSGSAAAQLQALLPLSV